MSDKLTYKELEQRVKEFENEAFDRKQDISVGGDVILGQPDIKTMAD